METTINIQMLDGILSGDKIYFMSNSNVKMVNLQRNSLRINNYKNIPAVYILLGEKYNNDGKRHMYIGQTSNISRRLNEHLDKKEFWVEVVFFVCGKQLTKTETEYLESSLLQTLIFNRQFDILTNYQIPLNIVIDSIDKCQMDEMLLTIKLLLEVFGCVLSTNNISESVKESKPNNSKSIITRIAKEYKSLPDISYDEEDNIVSVVEDGNQIATYFDIGNGQILISKGSTIIINDMNNISAERKKLLRQYKEKINNNILINDILVNNERQAKIILGI